MTETETLRAFFEAWDELQKMPKAKGRPGPERKASEDLVQMRAQAVRNWRDGAPPIPTLSVEAQNLRALQQQVAAIPPKSTHGQKPQ